MSKYQETKKYLSKVKQLQRHIRVLEMAIEQQRQFMERWGWMVNTRYAENTISEYEKEILNCKEEIAKRIEKVCSVSNDEQREILHRHFIENNTFEEIADEMFISTRVIYNKYNLALENFQEV